MTEPTDTDLIELATPYALHAVSDTDRDDIEGRLARAGLATADAFYDEVRAVRETMAVVSAATAAEPPAELRQQILDAVSGDVVRTLPTVRERRESPNRRWRSTVLAAAAALVVGLGAVGVVLTLRPSQEPSTAQQVFAAPDVHTISGDIPVGGTATVVFSRDKHAGVLVMNDVPPPAPGTVYQMWLLGDNGPTSAGTMDAKAVAPSTTAVLSDLGNSTALAFTVEPGSGSTEPTGKFIAELPLV